MARTMALGNGDVLVELDELARVSDFYFHYVGLENHIGQKTFHRIGVMVDGEFSWFSKEDWDFQIKYKKNSLVSQIKATNEKLKVQLDFEDAVYNEKAIFIRRISITNKASWKRSVKLFLHQGFEIYETERGDTGYYDPDLKALIHYEGRRVFLVGALSNGKDFEEFSVGNYGIEGKEGTWKDAEDGVLSKNPVEYAFVDSVIGFYFELEARAKERVEYWICAGKSIEEVSDLNDYVKRKTPEHLIVSTQDFWRAWLKKAQINFRDLPDYVVEIFKISLLAMRTHTGNNGGIIASGDSSMLQYGKGTYAYVWPRDASFVAMAFDRIGYHHLSRKFFEFCADTISRDGYFFHKYLSDKSVGSSWHPWFKDGEKQLAIQEEETALVIFALWKHFQSEGDVEFIESIYNDLIKKAGDFMVDYREEESRLPLASYDIWEQKFAVSTFCACSVYAGLMAVSNFAKVLGKRDDQENFKSVAVEIKEAILKHLFNEKTEFFYKSVLMKKDSWEFDETIDASSFFGMFFFGVLPADDPLMIRAFKILKGKLFNKNQVGGVIRYENDPYHRKNQADLSNPWFITTLWMAQFRIAVAENQKELEEVKEVFDWVKKYALPSGLLSEQISWETGKPISAAPLVWSHAQLVLAIADYLERFETVGKKIKIKSQS